MIARSRLMLGSIEAVFDTSATDEVLSGVDKVEIRLHVLDQAHRAASFLKTPLRRVDFKNRNGNLQIDIYGEQPEVLRGIDFIFPH
jgi:molybdopterin/thiamine biosynthesis adenylyltransferase